MPQPFKDAELDALDRVAERRAQAESWGRTVPVPLPLPDGEAAAEATPEVQHYVAWIRLKGGDSARLALGPFADDEAALEHAQVLAPAKFGQWRVEGISVLARAN